MKFYEMLYVYMVDAQQFYLINNRSAIKPATHKILYNFKKDTLVIYKTLKINDDTESTEVIWTDLSNQHVKTIR